MDKFSCCPFCGGKLKKISEDTLKCTFCRKEHKDGKEESKPIPEQLAMQLSQASNYMILRRYDDAAETYRVISKNYPGEVRAYWGAALAEFGIEYVEEGGITHPITNRLNRHSFMDNVALKKVLEKCGAGEREIYMMKANEIERIRSQAYEISRTQEPYEIFICGGEGVNEKRVAEELVSSFEAKGRKVFTPKTNLTQGNYPQAVHKTPIASAGVI